MCVCLLMSSSSLLLGTLLPLYVFIRTSTDVLLSELPQRLGDTLFHRKSSFCCAEWCPLVAVQARLMLRPWTYVCRRIEEVVYLEGKGKRILFLIPSRYTTSSIRLHTYVHGLTIKRASTATRVHALHTGKAHSALQDVVR
jgi:hypothetical protein